MSDPKYFSTFSDGSEDYVVKDSKARSDLSTHEQSTVIGANGLHGIRYVDGVLSYKKGDGTWGEILIRYLDMTGATAEENGAAGLVPAPTSSERGKFLRGDGTWAKVNTDTLSVMIGATSENNGTLGFVPAPTTSDTGKYLKGDGTWGTITLPTDMVGATDQNHGAAGLVPKPFTGDRIKYLKGDGTWADIPTMTGASAQNSGSSGLVPAPTSSDAGKYLKGDGSWAEVQNVSTMTGATSNADGTSGSVPAPTSADIGKFLCGDGTWKTISVSEVSDIVTISYNDYLDLTTEEKNDGTTYFVPDAPQTVFDYIGHKIKNASGTTMTDRTNLRFNGMTVTDDSLNDSTIIAPNAMIGATSNAAGSSGVVPAPAMADFNKFLRGDGTWAVPADDPGHTIKNASGTEMTRRAALKFEGMTVIDDSSNNQTVITPDLSSYSTTSVADERYEKKKHWVSTTIAANGWDSTTSIYSFESLYPSSTYDIIDILPSESATDAQRKAWSKSDCGGYYTTNIIKAHGTVPEVDIPVMLCYENV